MTGYAVNFQGIPGTVRAGKFIPANGSTPTPVRWESTEWPPQFTLKPCSPKS